MKIRNWKIRLVIAVLLSVIAVYLIFPSLFNSILDLIWRYRSKLWGWILELVLLISALVVFWRYSLKSRDIMGNLIKILVMLGSILFISTMLEESSFISTFLEESLLLTQFIDFVLTALALKNLGIGYIIGSVLGFSGVLYGLHLRNKQLEAFSNRTVEDRFIRSVDLIGNKEQASRLGGLVGLGTLMYENVELYERVLNYLGKFLRSPPDLEGWKWKWESESESSINLNNTLRCWQTSDKQDAKSSDKQDAESFDKKEPEGVLIGKRPDINYIVQILQDRDKEGKVRPQWMEGVFIPFEKVHLEGADLTKINLKNAKLARANLEETYLIEVNLENANLFQANLKGANLWQTNLKGTNLLQTNLEGANLLQTNLEGANLWQTNLLNTNITGTDITGTDLRETENLTEDQLKECYYVEDPPLLPSGWDAERIGIKKRGAE